ncbi:MAG: phosphoribosylamine--glycine ligase [Gemmatimonadota bacterium]
MRILIVGSGGREHALLWALHRDAPDAAFFCAPGNPGTALLASNLAVAANDIDGLVAAAIEHAVTLVIIGPEVPLALGLADRLRERGIPVFGPSGAAARIEASKSFAKALMERAQVPTAASHTFTDMDKALAYVETHAEPLVVKASGLAAGKGAVVAETRGEAQRAVRAMMRDRSLGDAGVELVIEDFMEGEELSLFAITNGRDFVLLPAAQDHKRLDEDDRGPNTGGMGAYSPVSLATPELLAQVERTILIPTLTQMEKEGSPFSGLLYAGLMIGRTGSARVVEFNCRFGDPETEAVLPLLGGGLLNSLERVARGEAPSAIQLKDNCFAVTTVLAAKGYPDRPEKGAAIALPREVAEGVSIFHAGTSREDGDVLRVSGGRVFAVTGVAATFAEAQHKSRNAAASIEFEGKVFRRDIGWREASRRA